MIDVTSLSFLVYEFVSQKLSWNLVLVYSVLSVLFLYCLLPCGCIRAIWAGSLEFLDVCSFSLLLLECRLESISIYLSVTCFLDDFYMFSNFKGFSLCEFLWRQFKSDMIIFYLLIILKKAITKHKVTPIQSDYLIL